MTDANGAAERDVNLMEDNRRPGSMAGPDELYQTADFVTGCHERACTPYVVQNNSNRRSAIAQARLRSASTSTNASKVVGWIKTLGMRQTRHRGPCRRWLQPCAHA